MLYFTEFKAQDLIDIELQDQQQHVRDADPVGYQSVAKQMESMPSFTIWHPEYRLPLAIVSVPTITPGRIMCCTFLARSAKSHMLGITRIIRDGLARLNARRIEAVTETNFIQGNKWLKLFGFELEGTMRSYDYRGVDYNLYSIVRK